MSALHLLPYTFPVQEGGVALEKKRRTLIHRLSTVTKKNADMYYSEASASFALSDFFRCKV